VSEATGSVTVESQAAVRGDEVTGVHVPCGKCQYEKPPTGPLGLSRDIWVHIFLWLIPIIFAAGMLFLSIKNMEFRVDENADTIERFGDQQQQIHTEQKVHANKLDTIQAVQAEMKVDVQKVDDKLDDQKDDLAAIKAKLGVRDRRPVDD
jgi:hypothetical protein